MELSTKERVPNILCYKYAVSVVRKGILKKSINNELPMLGLEMLNKDFQHLSTIYPQ